MIFDESPRKNKGVVTGNFFFENKSVNAIPYDCQSGVLQRPRVSTGLDTDDQKMETDYYPRHT